LQGKGAEKLSADNQQSEVEKKRSEVRLAEQRSYLQKEMHIRQDYYSLNFFHKLIIVSLFIGTFMSVIVLGLSYVEGPKKLIMDFIEKCL